MLEGVPRQLDFATYVQHRAECAGVSVSMQPGACGGVMHNVA